MTHEGHRVLGSRTMATHSWLYDPAAMTFLGVWRQQLWADLMIWEKFFQEMQFRSLIEMGTFKGGMSLFLLAHCMQRGIHFWTMDISDEVEDTPVASALGLKARCLHMDIFGDGYSWIEDMLNRTEGAGKPIVLLCDDGDKPREVQTFAPLLKPGDFLAVHDWLFNIWPKDVEPVGALLEPLYWADCEKSESRTRFWRRI